MRSGRVENNSPVKSSRSRSKSESRTADSGFNLERSDEVASKIRDLPNHLNKTWGLDINHNKWENLFQKLQRQERYLLSLMK